MGKKLPRGCLTGLVLEQSLETNRIPIQRIPIGLHYKGLQGLLKGIKKRNLLRSTSTRL